LKNEHRKIQAEEQRNKRKAQWQDFQNKGKVSKKAKKGGDSIFQSPDTIEGKVGVVGSGKKMTEFKVQKYEPKKLTSSLPVGVTPKKAEKTQEFCHLIPQNVFTRQCECIADAATPIIRPHA